MFHENSIGDKSQLSVLHRDCDPTSRSIAFNLFPQKDWTWYHIEVCLLHHTALLAVSTRYERGIPAFFTSPDIGCALTGVIHTSV